MLCTATAVSSYARSAHRAACHICGNYTNTWPFQSLWQRLIGCCVQVYVNQNVNRTDILLLIGAIYYQLGNYKQCIAFNDRCIMLDPHMAEAHANLANALQQLSNFDMAMIYYQVRKPVPTLSGSQALWALVTGKDTLCLAHVGAGSTFFNLDTQ